MVDVLRESELRQCVDIDAEGLPSLSRLRLPVWRAHRGERGGVPPGAGVSVALQARAAHP